MSNKTFQSGNESQDEGETCQLGEIMKQDDMKKEIIQGKQCAQPEFLILLGMLQVEPVLQRLASAGWQMEKRHFRVRVWKLRA